MAGNQGSVNILFEGDVLNSQGEAKATEIGEAFTELLGKLTSIVGQTNSREFSLVQTKLQEAYFWAYRAMALEGENRAPGQ